MYALDNDSGVKTMPEIKSQKFNATEPRWFSEGGNGVAPSYPGADWFNIVQAELLNVLKDGGIQAHKTQLNQITTAIRQIVANAVSSGLNGKANTNHGHTISQISNLQSTLDAKANTASPAFSGTPTAPTAPQSTNNQQIATTQFVKTAIAALVGSAPAALDTLAELAAALGQDANFRTTVLNLIASKADSSHTHTANQITDFSTAVANLFLTQKIGNINVLRLPDGTMIQRGFFDESTQDRFTQVTFAFAYTEPPTVIATVKTDRAHSGSDIISCHVGSISATAFYTGISENVGGHMARTNWLAIGAWK